MDSWQKRQVFHHQRRSIQTSAHRDGLYSNYNYCQEAYPIVGHTGLPLARSLTDACSSFKNFQIWDVPGQIDFLHADFDADSIFASAGAMVWVLDAQDDYLESVSRLTETILQLQQMYPDIKYSVFIHKVDSLSSDYREDTVRDIKQRILDDLNDAGLENPPVSFYPTSVYDDSIYEALSKILQLLNPQLATFEALLNTIAGSCKMQKLYLFDVLSKLYIASDTSPVDMAGYTLCSDYIDTIVDLSEIYGWDRGRLENGTNEDGDKTPKTEEGNAESFICGVRGYCLYLKEMNKFLALIGFSKEPRFAEEKPLIDYNVQIFQEALGRVLALT
jgi:Ras-related GTP-binding protein C/D